MSIDTVVIPVILDKRFNLLIVEGCGGSQMLSTILNNVDIGDYQDNTL